jgi:hypothetical protein
MDHFLSERVVVAAIQMVVVVDERFDVLTFGSKMNPIGGVGGRCRFDMMLSETLCEHRDCDLISMHSEYTQVLEILSLEAKFKNKYALQKRYPIECIRVNVFKLLSVKERGSLDVLYPASLSRRGVS